MNKALQNISQNYCDLLGDPLDDDRLNEIDDLLQECVWMADVEELADCDDATISFGEFEAIRQEIDGKPNHWNIYPYQRGPQS